MLKLTVNGQQHTTDADPSLSLMWYLRDELNLTGTKFGCGIAQCGACTVHVDGQAVRSCTLKIQDVANAAVVTIEGLDPAGEHTVQKAWRTVNVPQCGFCQAGQIMQAAALLAANPRPTDDEIDQAMAGNICRCGCYQRIHTAVRLAATGV